MKKTANDSQVVELINNYSKIMGGVFSIADLFNLIKTPSKLANHRTIRRLQEAGILLRCQKGLYVTKDFDLWVLASRLVKNSYVSMDSVLARNGLIGTLPTLHVSVVVSGKSRKPIRVRNKQVDFYSIADNLFFGFSRNQKGIPVADNEKAFLDLLYYYLRGYKFIIDPRNEVDVSGLNRAKIKDYLKRYKNPKFASFIKGVIYG